MEPSHAETLAALDGLVHGKDGEPVLAARVLEPIYEATGEYRQARRCPRGDGREHRGPALARRAAPPDRHLSRADDRQREARHSMPTRARCGTISGNQLTLGHIERLAEITGSFEALSKLYQAESEKSLDVPRQVDLLSRLARVYEQELADIPKAIATLRRILDAEFDNKPAVLGLDRLYSQTSAWPELADILKREIQLGEPNEIPTLQFRLGQTLQHQLGDRKGAVEVYREILTENPTHESTLAALEDMFHGGHLQPEIHALLEPLYESASEYGKLHAIHEVQLGKLAGPDRQAMYQRLAELAEGKLYDQPKAFHWWSEAIVEDPRWDHALEESERLAGQTGAWEELVAAYTRGLDRTSDREIKRLTLLRMARVYEFELGDAANAVATHLRALEIEAKDPDALAALDRLYLTAGMYDDLAEILRRRIEVTQDPDEQLELYFRRGQIFSDALGDLDQALACYTAILEQESRNRRALECIEAIHFRREAWQKLFETYEKLIDVAADDAEMADVYARMARISSEALSSEDKAIEYWQKVLDIRGEEPQALQALSELCQRRERWDELVEIIERQVAVAQSDQDQIRLYKSLGNVWEHKLQRERNALDAWLAADRIDGHDLETLRSLAHLYRSTQAWDELSQTLRRIIDVGNLNGEVSENETIELYAQLGQLEGEVLGRVDDAVEAWRRVVSIDPSDFRALAALEGLFTREGRWEEAIDVLEKRALVLDDELQRRENLLQAAATWEEKVENLTKAAEVYERVRAGDPSNVTASDRLEAIYTQQYKWTELVEVLLEQSELRPSVEEQITILNRVAKIYEQEIGDQESAFYVLQAAFKRDYSHDITANELERLATATNRWQELLDEYTNRVNELEREDRGSGRGPVGQDRSLVRRAPEPPRVRDPLGAAGAAHRSRAHRCTRRHGRSAAQARLVDRAVETLQRHAASRPARTRRPTSTSRSPSCSSGRCRIRARPSTPTSRRSTTPGVARGARRARSPVPPTEHVGAAHRRARRAESIDLDAGGDEQEVIKFRLEIGQIWDLRLYDAGQAIAVLPRRPRRRSAQPDRAARARGALREDQSVREVPRGPRGPARRVTVGRERMSLYERMAAGVGRALRQARPRRRVPREDRRPRRPQLRRYRELARLYHQAASGKRWSRPTATTSSTRRTSQTRVDLYCAMGAVYEQQLGTSTARSRPTSTCCGSTRRAACARRARSPVREDQRVGSRDRDDGAAGPAHRRPASSRSTCTRGSAASSTASSATPTEAEANLLRGLAIDPGHVPTMEALTKLYSDRGDWLKAAQMMVRAEAVHPGRDRQGPPAVRGGPDLRRQAAPERRRQAAVRRGDLARPRARRGRPAAGRPLLRVARSGRAVAGDRHAGAEGRAAARRRPARAQRALLPRRAHGRRAGRLPEGAPLLQASLRHRLDLPADPVGRADLLYKMGDWDNAGKIYQTILVQHRDGQEEADVVRIYNRLGMVRQNLNERKKALNMFEKALEIDPTHRDTLEAVIALQSSRATGKRWSTPSAA
jgi:tetratricopeptide (TPR) repeat protein